MANYDQSILMRVAQEEGIDPALLSSVVMAESGGNPMAKSPKGASGLMQLMPATAQELGVTDVFDPEQNLRGGAKYLRQQLERFGDPSLALAAYNAGPANVDKYQGIPPFEETQNYIAKILGGQKMADVTQPTAAPSAAPYDPMANLSKSQRMMLAFGALRDAGTALRGGQGNAFATTMASVQDQQKLGAQMQQRTQLNEYIQGLTTPPPSTSGYIDPTKPLGAPSVSGSELVGTPTIAPQTTPLAGRSALQSQIGKLTAAAQVAATIDPVAAARLSVQAAQLQAQLDNMPTSQNLTPDEVSELGLPIGTVAQRDISGKINVVSKPDKPSEAEAKTLTYEARAAGALPKVDKLELSLTGGWDKFLESGQGIPAIELATSYMQSEDYKRARNAGLEFVSAILRKDSGATITAEEEALANRQYLPVPNDSTSVLKDKREARHRALEALREGLPAAEIDKRAKDGFKTQAQDAAATPIPQGSGPIVINGYTIEAIE